MPRAPRFTFGDIVYHVLNRATGGLAIFERKMDFSAFEDIIAAAKQRIDIRILAYCLMPNHWHLVLYPTQDNALSSFMKWLTQTHAQRWHANRHSIGYGHLYQGRFKSFPVQQDVHLLQLCRYVERNPLRAGLVSQAQEWRWSSLWIREFGSAHQRRLLSEWPTDMPPDYLNWINEPQSLDAANIDSMRFSISRGTPFGDRDWSQATAARLGLSMTLKERGRPIKQKGV